MPLLSKKFRSKFRLSLLYLRRRRRELRRAKKRLIYSYAFYRFRLDQKQHQFRRAIEARNRLLLVGAALGAFLACSIGTYLWLLPTVDYAANYSIVASLFQQIASGLIGTAVVCISLITFFLQSNLTRLPHSLFTRLSFDIAVITYFLVAFIASLIAGLLSLFLRAELGSEFVLAFICVSGLVVSMLLMSFTRALQLVNPGYQLHRLLKDEQGLLGWWNARMELARPLLSSAKNNPRKSRAFDEAKHIFFEKNANWTRSTMGAIQHTGAFVRQYAAAGDYSVTRAAFSTLASLNSSYITVKGATFFAANPFIHDWRSTDAVVNESLEQIRQLHALAASRRDEELLRQCHDAYVTLSEVYERIDYGEERAEKTHVRLALAYLSRDIERVIPLGAADVLMHGTRLITNAGHRASYREDFQTVWLVNDQLAKFALLSLASTDFQPVSSTVVQGLGRLLLDTFVARAPGFQAVQQRIFASILLPCELYLKAKKIDEPDTLSYRPGDFFSLTSMDSFSSGLTDIINEIVSTDEITSEIKHVLRNIEHWAAHIAVPVRELFTLSIEKDSFLAHDIVQWTSHTAKVFFALDGIPGMPTHLRGKFERHAERLIYAFTWIPESKAAIGFVENLSLTDTIVEIGLEALRYAQASGLRETISVLLNWGCRAGRFPGGWVTFQHSLMGAATLAALAEEKGEPVDLRPILIKQKALLQVVSPDEIARAREAFDEVREGWRERRYSLSVLDSALSQAHPDMFQKHLEFIKAALPTN